jgi:hypothetical protein
MDSDVIHCNILYSEHLEMICGEKKDIEKWCDGNESRFFIITDCVYILEILNEKKYIEALLKWG